MILRVSIAAARIRRNWRWERSIRVSVQAVFSLALSQLAATREPRGTTAMPTMQTSLLVGTVLLSVNGGFTTTTRTGKSLGHIVL